MRITILGAGAIATPLATAWAQAGHTVTLGLRGTGRTTTIPGVQLTEPVVEGRRADQFFTADPATVATAEALIADIGLRPVYLGGNDLAHVIDGVTRLWFCLVVKQGHSRRLNIGCREEPTVTVSEL